MDSNIENSNVENNNDKLAGIEYGDKLETKGLKLRKTTKDKLNSLQNQFDDAETMIVTLLQLYNSNQIESSDRFLDRKAEIQRFNFLLDSLKSSYVNSLEMATYAEEKSQEKFKKELQRRNITIENLQNDIITYKEQLKEASKNNSELNEELNSVKDSFSRVNLALTTVEKELNEKSNIIQNTQKHIESLNLMIAKEGESKKTILELNSKLENLEDIQKKYEVLDQLFITSKNECLKLNNNLESLTRDNEKQRTYSDSLNEKIQTLLSNHSLELSKVNEENKKIIFDIQKSNDAKVQKANDEMLKLKEEIFNLKLENEKLKFVAQGQQ